MLAQLLPHDVVADVAEFAVDDAASFLSIAHVCRAWRRHLLESPADHASGVMWGAVYHSVQPRHVPMPVTMDPAEMIAMMQQHASQGPAPATPGETAIISRLCLPRLANVKRLRPAHPAHFAALAQTLQSCAAAVTEFDGGRVRADLLPPGDISRVLGILATACPRLTRLRMSLSWARALHKAHPEAPLFDTVADFSVGPGVDDGDRPPEIEADKAAVVAALGRFTRLSHLGLAGLCLRDPASYAAISAGSAATLTSLDLMDAWILPPAVAAVARQCRGLRELGLSGIDLAEFPSEVVECLPELTSLDLSGNQCDDACVVALLDAMRRAGHEKLATVNLSGNPITNAAIVAFAAPGAPHCRCLRDVCVSYTAVDDGAAEALCGLGYLTALALNSTLVSDEQLQRVQDAIGGTTRVDV